MPPPRDGIQPRCSGLRVQGTASSPPSATGPEDGSSGALLFSPPPGRIAQRESARFTRGRSLVRSQVRPLRETPAISCKLSVAEWERDVIAQRTRDALASAKVHGTKSGNPIGRPRELDPKVRARLRRLRSKGWSYKRIADYLNAEGVTPARGGKWYSASVRKATQAA